MKQKLKNCSYKLLEECVIRHNKELLPIVEKSKYCQLTQDECLSLMDIVSDEFCAQGLKDDYEPNEYGLRLDDLIGEIAIVFGLYE